MRHRLIGLGIFALVLGGIAWATCGIIPVCGDMNTSFHGVVTGDSITVSWSTSNEDSALLEYRLYRYNCTSPGCWHLVATITPTGSCGTNEPYSVQENPPTPVSQWTYSLEAWRVSGPSRACAVDTVPQ